MLTLRVRTVLAAACAALFVSTVAFAAKATSCAKVSLCYCMNDAHKIAIDSRFERLLQLLAEQRKAGKAIDYLGPTESRGRRQLRREQGSGRVVQAGRVVYDGQSVAPPRVAAPVADGYVGKCAM